MTVTGLYVQEGKDKNTVEAVDFALRYFKDLGHDTTDGKLSDPLKQADVAILSVPYVGAHIAEGFDFIADKLNEEQEVHWLLMLIKDDVLEKSKLTIDALAEALKERGKIDIVTFDNMTSERHIPLQTRDMMQIMKACDGIHKLYK